MATGIIFTNGKFQGIGNDGNVVPYGKLYFTDNEGAPVATYRDSKLSSTNPYPIILSASGKADVYILDGDYNVTLQDKNGVEVWTIANFVPTGGTGSTGGGGTGDAEILEQWIENFTAVTGQKTFTATRDLTGANVYVNGIWQTESNDYTTNGIILTLNVAAEADDEVAIVGSQPAIGVSAAEVQANLEVVKTQLKTHTPSMGTSYMASGTLDQSVGTPIDWVDLAGYTIGQTRRDPSEIGAGVYIAITNHTAAGVFPKDDPTNWSLYDLGMTVTLSDAALYFTLGHDGNGALNEVEIIPSLELGTAYAKGLNYIKKVKGGSYSTTLIKPVANASSVTADYFLDEVWYDKNGVPYATTICYLKYAVEADAAGNIIKVYNADVFGRNYELFDYYKSEQLYTKDLLYTKNEIDLAVAERRKLYAGEPATIIPDADADYTLSLDENKYSELTLTDGPWLSGHSIIVDTSIRKFIVNNYSGSFGATVITPAGTGVLVDAGQSVRLYCDGTNVEFEHISGTVIGGTTLVRTTDITAGSTTDVIIGDLSTTYVTKESSAKSKVEVELKVPLLEATTTSNLTTNFCGGAIKIKEGGVERSLSRYGSYSTQVFYSSNICNFIKTNHSKGQSIDFDSTIATLLNSITSTARGSGKPQLTIREVLI